MILLLLYVLHIIDATYTLLFDTLLIRALIKKSH